MNIQIPIVEEIFIHQFESFRKNIATNRILKSRRLLIPRLL